MDSGVMEEDVIPSQTTVPSNAPLAVERGDINNHNGSGAQEPPTTAGK